MKAIGYALNLVVAVLFTIGAVACSVPSVDFLRRYDTMTVALCIISVLLVIFFFILKSRNWKAACAKGMLILSLVLAVNVGIDVIDLYFQSSSKMVSVAGGQKLEVSSALFLLGSFIMATVSVMLFLLSKEDFSGLKRSQNFKIPKF